MVHLLSRAKVQSDPALHGQQSVAKPMWPNYSTNELLDWTGCGAVSVTKKLTIHHGYQKGEKD